MVIGFAELEKLSWKHAGYGFGVFVGHESSEGTGECSVRKCYRWQTYGSGFFPSRPHPPSPSLALDSPLPVVVFFLLSIFKT